MTLQASGSMSIADINAELGRPAGNILNFSDPEVLSLAGRSAAQSINFPRDFFSKSHNIGLVASGTITVGSGLNSRGYSGSSGYSYGGVAWSSYSNNNIDVFFFHQAADSVSPYVFDYKYALGLRGEGLEQSSITSATFDGVDLGAPTAYDTTESLDGLIHRWYFGSSGSGGFTVNDGENINISIG